MKRPVIDITCNYDYDDVLSSGTTLQTAASSGIFPPKAIPAPSKRLAVPLC